MVNKQLFLCLLVTLLSSCAVLNKNQDLVLTQDIKASSTLDLQSEELKNLPSAKVRPTIAIYPNSFRDLTGQRRSNSSFALFSTAITQAPEAFLIRAFKHAAGGEFFRVVERVGLDDLTKERQLIRSLLVKNLKKIIRCNHCFLQGYWFREELLAMRLTSNLEVLVLGI